MPVDSVQAERLHNGLICIRNHRYHGDRDLGGSFVVDPESVSWLADAIEALISTRISSERSFANDRLQVQFAGHESNPLLAIFNRRNPDALQGGARTQSMQISVAAQLASQLKQLVPRLAQEEVRLPPAIPVEIDDATVAMGSAAPGPYLRVDGSEAYGRAATVTLLADGSQQEIGVGGVLRLGKRSWVATAFEADGSLVLQPADALETPPPTPESSNPIIYPDAEMANLWVQWHLPFATWRVDLRDAARRNPEELRQFAAAILRAGEESGAMRIVQLPQYGYRRAEDGPLLPHLEQRWQALGGPDLFSDTQGMIVESQVAWLDGTGRLFDTPVKHLELILEMDEPVDGALDGFREPHPPVAISGPSWPVIQRASQGLTTGPLELEITLYSDIWFPWISGMGHPLADHVRKFDNRVLAEKHTPRLNAFLREVHRAAVTIGSRLQLDRDECRVRPEYVSDQGVELNVPAPTQQMTEAERNAPWS